MDCRLRLLQCVWQFQTVCRRLGKERLHCQLQGKLGVDHRDHQQALKKAISDITTLIKETFGNAANQLTLVCIPASTRANTKRRFEEFSKEVCEKTGMANAYPLISWTTRTNPDDGEEEDEYTFDFEAIKSKDILLFDDIIASGSSVCKFADKLKKEGANVIAAIALGKKL